SDPSGTRDAPPAGKSLARAHRRPADRKMADEERLPANCGPQVQLPCRAHAALEWRNRLRGPRRPTQRTPLPYLELFGGRGGKTEDRRRVDADADEGRRSRADGAIGLRPRR